MQRRYFIFRLLHVLVLLVVQEFRVVHVHRSAAAFCLQSQRVLHGGARQRHHGRVRVPWTLLSSFESMLQDRLKRNDTSLMTLDGYVLSKRSLGKGLVFVDLQIPGYSDLCQAMLRGEYANNFNNLRPLFLKGTQVRVTGSAAPTRNPGNVVLLIQHADFVGFPRQLQYIQTLLQEYQNGNIDWERILSAAGSPMKNSTLYARLVQLQNESSSPEVVDKHFLKQLSRDILQALPDDPDYPNVLDQVVRPRKGEFVIATAPPEWQTVPARLLQDRLGMDDDTGVLAPQSVRQILLQDSSDNDAPMRQNDTRISVTGWVQNRRRFDGNITTIALVNDYASLVASQDVSALQHLPPQRLLAVLHPDYLVPSRVAGLYGNLVTVGAKVTIQGRFHTTNDKNTTRRFLWVDSIRLEQSSSRSVTIRHLLDLLHDGQVELEEVARALLIPASSSSEEAKGLTKLSPTERQWKANELAIRLQDAANAGAEGSTTTSLSSTRELLVDSKLLRVLHRYRHLLDKHPIQTTTLQDMQELLTQDVFATKRAPQQDQPQQPAKGYIARATLPMGMAGTKWQHKKRPQLVWMGGQIRQVLQAHPEYGQRRLKVLDIGGGKGALANYLGHSMNEYLQVHVVDINEGAVVNGANKAERLNLPVDFSLADASQTLNVTADVVVALHACGHLSDVALAHAVQRQAGFVIVPCCFNSNGHLQIPAAGGSHYHDQVQVPVHDWLGIPPEDWSALKLLAEVQGDITLANEAIATLCAVRAEAVQKIMASHDKDAVVAIKRFPVEFSTRNTVIVGRVSASSNS